MQEVQNVFDKLPQEDKRKFLILNMLKDYKFGAYHANFKNDFMEYIYTKAKCEKLIKERTEKHFIDCSYSIFREYEDAVNKCIGNKKRNNEDIYQILRAQHIIETYAECEIINSKDRFGDNFTDMIVKLYKTTNPLVVKHLNNEDVSLKEALIILFENPHLNPKTREKYKKYEIEAHESNFDDTEINYDDDEMYNSAERRFLYGINESSSSESESESDSESSEFNCDDDDIYVSKPRPPMTEEEVFERLKTPIYLLNPHLYTQEEIQNNIKAAEKTEEKVEETKTLENKTKTTTKKTQAKKTEEQPKTQTKKAPVKKVVEKQ